jgi:pimeloyl-ACP methyl ester carboxylesterase
MAVVTKNNARPGYEERLRTVFPNLRGFQVWDGSGHFLMMESPDRFNRLLEDFLVKQ